MTEVGYQPDTPHSANAALDLRTANTIIKYGLSEDANEQNSYLSRHYTHQPKPQSHKTRQPNMVDPDRWQTLYIPNFVGQSGLSGDGYPDFIGPEWGNVKPFSLTEAYATTHGRDDIPSRIMGYKIGHLAFNKALEYFPKN